LKGAAGRPRFRGREEKGGEPQNTTYHKNRAGGRRIKLISFKGSTFSSSSLTFHVMRMQLANDHTLSLPQ